MRLTTRSVFIAYGCACAAALTTPAVQAQTPAAASPCPDNTPTVFHACALEASAAFDPPRTLDGRPDFGGVWNRPGTAFEDIEAHPAGLDDAGGPTIVVDPADGRVPVRGWADVRRRANVDEYIHPAAACFLSGVPYIMYRPGPYQILQTPEYLVILGERAHGYRIVTLTERPPIGDKIRLWNGVSAGRWEGTTLVIETTNQNGMSWLDQRARFYTEQARVVERLTLVDADTLHYQATLDDPSVYTQPFTISFPYRRNTVEGAELLEESCYENNETLVEIYRGLGFTVYPGITAAQAQQATDASR